MSQVSGNINGTQFLINLEEINSMSQISGNMNGTQIFSVILMKYIDELGNRQKQ